MLMSKINFFKKQGFVNLGSSFLNKTEIDELSLIAKNIYETMPEDHPDYIQDADGTGGIRHLPLHDVKLARIINKIISHASVKEFLIDILGKNHKLWSVNLRRSKPGDRGLYLHQDGVGQVNMAIYIDDNPKGFGATAVLPSSHLITNSQKKMRLEMPAILLNLFSFLFTPLVGLKGDVLFFSNRVWHGRFSNKSTERHDIVFIGFFPAGYRYNEPWSQEFIEINSGTELGRLLAAPSDIDGSIVSNCECRESSNILHSSEHGYSLDIENPGYLSKIRKPVRLLLSVFFIRLIMGAGRILYRPVKLYRRMIPHSLK